MVQFQIRTEQNQRRTKSLRTILRSKQEIRHLTSPGTSIQIFHALIGNLSK